MLEVAEAARRAIEAYGPPGSANEGTIRFSRCMVPSRHYRDGEPGFRWVTTNRHEVAAFFLACWNNRDALTAEIRRRSLDI